MEPAHRPRRARALFRARPPPRLPHLDVLRLDGGGLRQEVQAPLALLLLQLQGDAAHGAALDALHQVRGEARDLVPQALRRGRARAVAGHQRRERSAGGAGRSRCGARAARGTRLGLHDSHLVDDALVRVKVLRELVVVPLDEVAGGPLHRLGADAPLRARTGRCCSATATRGTPPVRPCTPRPQKADGRRGATGHGRGGPTQPARKGGLPRDRIRERTRHAANTSSRERWRRAAGRPRALRGRSAAGARNAPWFGRSVRTGGTQGAQKGQWARRGGPHRGRRGGGAMSDLTSGSQFAGSPGLGPKAASVARFGFGVWEARHERGPVSYSAVLRRPALREPRDASSRPQLGAPERDTLGWLAVPTFSVLATPARGPRSSRALASPVGRHGELSDPTGMASPDLLWPMDYVKVNLPTEEVGGRSSALTRTSGSQNARAVSSRPQGEGGAPWRRWQRVSSRT